MGKSQKKRKPKKIKNSFSLSPKNNNHEKISLSKIRYEKNRIRKLNPSIFHFNLDSKFIYESRFCSFFYEKLQDKNNMKPKSEDLMFLKDYEKNVEIQDSKEKDQGIIEVPKNIFMFFKNRIKIKPELDQKELNVKKIIEELKNEKFSSKKVSNYYQMKFGESISKSQLLLILKKKLGLHFLKTSIKNKILLNSESKKMSFFILKILIRHIKLGGSIIYLDESTFSTVNNNLKMWRRSGEQIFKEVKDSKKTNLILAVTPKRLIHFQLNRSNTDAVSFKEFILEMLESLDKNDIKNLVIFLDNASVHGTIDIMKICSEKNLKVVYNVPYLSYFNMVELCFRYLKKVIYNDIYSSIEEVESKLKNILNSDDFKNQLPLLFKETLRQYILFIEENINFNLNNS